jgi:uncharacterized repeat protein (TIGR01451 family)
LATPVAPKDDLSIIKTTTATNPIAGSDVTYSLAVGNAGPTADPGPVTVTDHLPNGETFVSASGTVAGEWNCAAAGTAPSQTVTCTYAPGAMVVNYSGTIKLTVALGAAAVPSIANTATITGTGSDPDPNNNTSSATIGVTPGTSLMLSKELSSGPLVAGHSATYVVSVKNLGPSPAAGLQIRDEMPAGLIPQSATGDGWTCSLSGQIVLCAYGLPLPNGIASSVTLVANVTATGGTIVNTASVTTSTALNTTSGTVASVSALVTTPGGLAFTGFDAQLVGGVGVSLIILGGVLNVNRRREQS